MHTFDLWSPMLQNLQYGPVSLFQISNEIHELIGKHPYIHSVDAPDGYRYLDSINLVYDDQFNLVDASQVYGNERVCEVANGTLKEHCYFANSRGKVLYMDPKPKPSPKKNWFAKLIRKVVGVFKK